MPRPATLPNQRLAVARVDAFVSGGASLVQACLRAGVSRANYYRWKTSEAALASANSAPGTANRESKPAKRGRPTLVELTEAEIHRLRYWRLIRDSVPLALQEFLRDDLCRPEVAALVRSIWQKALARHKRPSWPLSIRRALQVTDAEKANFRGEKHRSQCEVTERRGAWWIDEDGHEWPLEPNTIWESDDMSVNEPFRFYDAASARERLGRQTLQTKDVCSYKNLYVTHVGRERDAYRVEDIADHAWDLVSTYGMPVMWRIECGVWDNAFFFGVKLADGTLWGGIDQLIHIRQKFTSRGKGNIEGGFDHQQRWTAHGPKGDIISIGRSRGEFEQATKLYLKAQQTGDEATLRRFWTVEQSANFLQQALTEMNRTPVQRLMHGNRFLIPDELYGEPVQRQVPKGEEWRFLPVKKERVVSQGAIDIKVDHYAVPFRFRINGAAGMNGHHLDHGHRILVAFHPGRPQEGLHVFNGDRSAKNREGFSFGELIGLAEYLPERPSENLAGPGDHSSRKRERSAVRLEGRAIVSGTARATRKSHAQDGLGNVLRQANGLSVPGGSAPPPRQTRAGMLLPEGFNTDVARAASPPPVAQASRLPASTRATTTDTLATTEDRARGVLLL